MLNCAKNPWDLTPPLPVSWSVPPDVRFEGDGAITWFHDCSNEETSKTCTRMPCLFLLFLSCLAGLGGSSSLFQSQCPTSSLCPHLTLRNEPSTSCFQEGTGLSWSYTLVECAVVILISAKWGIFNCGSWNLPPCLPKPHLPYSYTDGQTKANTIFRSMLKRAENKAMENSDCISALKTGQIIQKSPNPWRHLAKENSGSILVYVNQGLLGHTSPFRLLYGLVCFMLF